MRKQITPKKQVIFILLSIFVIMVSVSSVSASPLPTSSQVYVSTMVQIPTMVQQKHHTLQYRKE